MDLLPELAPYWEAFGILHQRRPVGMDVGAIPISEITCYLNERQITDPALREEYLDMILALDAKFLDLHRKQSAAKGKK